MTEHKEPLRHEVPVEITQHPSKDYRTLAESVDALVNLNQHINEQKRRLDAAHIDEVTGLPNRKAFEQNFQSLVGRSERGERFAFALIDADGLKRVNDGLGHATGDKLLLSLGQGLLGALRPNDIVGRIGGDEFGILMPVGELDTEAEKIFIKGTKERIQSSVDQRIKETGFTGWGLGASVGVGVYKPGENAEEFRQRVDELMYEDKKARKAERT